MTEPIAVVLVLALLGVVVLVLKRRGLPVLAAAKERQLETIERLRLSPGHTVHLIRVGERRLLVATYTSGCTLLSDVDLTGEEVE